MDKELNSETKSSVKVCAILLAAGESRRMGDINKLELSVNGEPLIRRTARVLLASNLDHIIVVTGHQSDTVKALLDDLPISIVHNENYTEGQMTSVHKGMASLSRECDGVMVCLADQPLLETEDVNFLMEAFARRDQGSVVVPIYKGKRGNPIIMATEHREAILAGNRNLGCKRLIEKNPQLVTTIEMPNNHVVVDIDTPGDYETIAGKRYKGKDTREQQVVED